MMKGIIFDLDGTLAHSFPMIHKAYDHALSSIGFPIDFDAIPLLCFNRTEERITQELGAPERVNEFQEYYYAYLKAHIKDVQPFLQSQPVLDDLFKKHMPMTLVSFSQRWYVDAMLESLNIGMYFEKTISFNDVQNPKPDPEAAIVACHHMNVSPTETLVVGDSKNDVKMGKNATCKTALFANPLLATYHNIDTYIQESQPDYVIRTLAEIPPLLKD
jgi:HAD superfamily hydrolase (TIGR01549 family)